MPDVPADQAELFRRNCGECGYTADMILPHASFLINLCSPDKRKLHLSRMALVDEMRRCAALGLTMINFHPGAHLGQMSESEAAGLVAESINYVLAKTEGVTAVIENTAGQGSNIGYSFSGIAEMIAGVTDKSRVGVCVDTCHAFAAGYDLASEDGYRKCWEEFDSLIGAEYLRGMHFNDSKKELLSRIDRHESIGRGLIGRECFSRLMKDPRTDNIPLILETPDEMIWAQEIEWLVEESS